ncbi:hypothetical protein K440DRAFT_641503 [Wilcoxina mikolae CBS 423.85]|nr:hypothetical protein K440DRAFT_641503 [Wilcoxina mikolae CBS 423.85]
MAAAISLGASVLTFITVAAQLSKAANSLYDSIKDTPEEVRRLHARLGDLKFILSEIDLARSLNPQCVEDERIEVFWNNKAEKLHKDFTKFESFAKGLNGNGTIGRAHWLFLSAIDKRNSWRFFWRTLNF